MLKVWGRKNSSNVQKVMWTIGELGLACERIDIGGPFGGNRDALYLGMNPNGLVPTLQEDDFVLWESNSIVRYLAGKYGAGTLEPADPRTRARADQWMDWQLSVVNPAISPVFLGLVRTPPKQRDYKVIETCKAKAIEAMKILDAQLARTEFVAGDAFSMADIPLGIMAYRFFGLVPERPRLSELERWYGTLQTRPAFREHVTGIALQ